MAENLHLVRLGNGLGPQQGRLVFFDPHHVPDIQGTCLRLSADGVGMIELYEGKTLTDLVAELGEVFTPNSTLDIKEVKLVSN